MDQPPSSNDSSQNIRISTATLRRLAGKRKNENFFQEGHKPLPVDETIVEEKKGAQQAIEPASAQRETTISSAWCCFNLFKLWGKTSQGPSAPPTQEPFFTPLV